MKEKVKCSRYAWLLFLVRCSSPSPPSAADAAPDVPTPKLTIEQLKDPETCNQCHTKHYRDWLGSMHAYAADDPMFLAMNDRGQREANIGNLCVQCHAPMAIAEAPPGTIIDTAKLKELPKSQRGVTCYFCHQIDAVTNTHNNPLHLANDGVMRGRYNDAVPNEGHASAYSTLLDGPHLDSANACGSCHDIVNGQGSHVERTFEEWKTSVFAYPVSGLPCARCHVGFEQRDVIADGPKVQGVRVRDRHDHKMAAVDRALTPFPEIDAQALAVRKALNDPPVIQTALCVAEFPPESKIIVIVDNLQAGHMVPSGAAQDRQLWFEVTAFKDGSEIYQSGHVPAGTDATESTDEDLWLMRDCMFDEQGTETSPTRYQRR
jgi:hypothetical protein